MTILHSLHVHSQTQKHHYGPYHFHHINSHFHRILSDVIDVIDSLRRTDSRPIDE